MILLCPISGQHWVSSGFNSPGQLSGLCPHPIFKYSFEDLSAVWNCNPEYIDSLSPNDIRLFSLALLNSSGLVSWESPARHDFDLSLAYEAIPELISEIYFILDPARTKAQIEATFARLVISQDSNDMEIMPEICKEWRQNANDYYENLAETRRHEANKQALESLSRLLATSYKNPARYITHLASWVIKSLGIPDIVTIEVTDLQTSKQIALPESIYYRYLIEYSGNVQKGGYLYSINAQAIERLLDIMLDRLDYSNSFCFTASGLLRQLLETGTYHQASGFQANYVRSSAVSEYLSLEVLPEPIRDEYPDSTSFFLAKAKWRSQQAALNNSNNSNNSNNNISGE